MKWIYLTPRQRGDWIRWHAKSMHAVDVCRLFQITDEVFQDILEGGDYPVEATDCQVDISRAPLLKEALKP